MIYNSRGSGFLSSFPPVIKNLLIINSIMLIISMFAGDFMFEKFSLFHINSPYFRPYQFVSHMFMHGDFIHLFFNMYSLIIFGVVLEQVWGSQKFLFYYLSTGLGAAVLHSLVMYISGISMLESGNTIAYQNLMATPTVGASGAVYGVLLAYGMLFPNNILQLLFPPVALKAKWFVLIFGGIEFVLGVSNSGGNIAHFAHLGGMLFGFIIIKYWKSKNKLFF